MPEPRAGFGWLDDPGAYVRVATIANRPDAVFIDVRAPEHVPEFPDENGGLGWWDNPADVAALRKVVQRAVGGHARVTRIRRPCRFIVTRAGTFVKWLP
jgi:hypothetical protein